MVENRFHRAAKDGYIDLLKEGNKRDLNVRDEDGMTAVHWAAYCGNLEALRVIVGRGGDVDAANIWGNTALHFAVRNSHMNCVSFLAHFGCNLWSIDNDGATALEIGGHLERVEIVKFLDAEMTRQMTLNPKEVAKKKLRAVEDAERRVRRLQKHLKKARATSEGDQEMTEESTEENRRDFPPLPPIPPDPLTLLFGTDRPAQKVAEMAKAVGDARRQSVWKTFGYKLRATLRIKAKSVRGGDAEELTARLRKMTIESKRVYGSAKFGQPPTFSEHVELVKSRKNGRSSIAMVQKRCRSGFESKSFKESRALSQSADVLYANPMDEIGNDSGICDLSPEPCSIFERPGFGSMSFRNWHTNGTLLNIPNGDGTQSVSKESADSRSVGEDSGAAESRWNGADICLDDANTTPLEAFLEGHDLQDYVVAFTRERISLESLMLLTETDLQALKIPMGPRKMLLEAIAQRRRASEGSDGERF